MKMLPGIGLGMILGSAVLGLLFARAEKWDLVVFQGFWALLGLGMILTAIAMRPGHESSER